ncbi:hypothetical protein KFK09_006427 [Dendrobium nobile]|uniref:Uncharacterized protein n=1 Tax=Dendrobium nobile TaxID=94219 RepID=A0A8T3BPK5_DENNO|nr:hypothetical protein KFK09_006427 [Dendrobium nobile]
MLKFIVHSSANQVPCSPCCLFKFNMSSNYLALSLLQCSSSSQNSLHQTHLSSS